MSGGHFDYIQFRIDEAATDVGVLVKANNYPPEVIEKFKEAQLTLRKAATMLNRVDYLVSGDDGEESFMKRWDDDLRKC